MKPSEAIRAAARSTLGRGNYIERSNRWEGAIVDAILAYLDAQVVNPLHASDPALREVLTRAELARVHADAANIGVYPWHDSDDVSQTVPHICSRPDGHSGACNGHPRENCPEASE